MDEDENLSLLLSMGFPDIEEAQRALRAAKNDLNEAVRDYIQRLLKILLIKDQYSVPKKEWYQARKNKHSVNKEVYH